MKRHINPPRAQWEAKVEGVGLLYHSHENGPYWNESAHYSFESAEIDLLEKAANDLHLMCIEAAGKIIETDAWHRLRIPEECRKKIVASWEADDFSLYGRFDVAYDGVSPPKLLEYNADTPTSLIESSVAQWYWLNDRFPNDDQFNSIHESLVAAWKKLSPGSVHFSCLDDCLEDEQTIRYLQDTCHQAGFPTFRLKVEEIGWDERHKRFCDLQLKNIETCFKLYPWEWMYGDEFSKYLGSSQIRWIEPAWKMMLSNKGLLPILWEMFPDHPNLLPAYEEPSRFNGNYVSKPYYSREGSNVRIVQDGAIEMETGGDYDSDDCIFQARASIPEFNGNFPVLGLWVINHSASGMGVREDDGLITTNLSRFVPHRFTPT